LRLLCIGDLHNQIERLSSLEADADMIIVCGDLHDRGSEAEVRQVVEALAGLGQRVLIVPGNMDPVFSMRLWEEAGFISMHRRAVCLDGLGFIGMGGMVLRRERRPEDEQRFYHQDEEMYQVLAQCIGAIEGAYRKVVVTHQPPFGILDTLYSGQPSGCHSLRRFLEDYQPDLLLCGHIHEARGEARLGSTKIVNVGELRKGYSVMVDMDGGLEIIWPEQQANALFSGNFRRSSERL
jgi:Icc-related predicted phosphoesterase